MNFRSDNVTGIHPAILAAIEAANKGAAASYGADEISARVERRLAELFEHEVAVFPVATGTAANALALAALVPPWGVVYAHEESHIQVDECGAPEFYAGGAKIVPLSGAHGKIAAEPIVALAGPVRGVVHHAQPAAISISQASEAGTVYTQTEVGALGDAARRLGLALHMDGARFANALVHLGCTPADVTWRAGVDVVSFGATKNGALAAEAVVFFDRAKAADFAYRRKRGGHLFSKMRFLSAQLDAYLAGDLWLANARQANAMAQRLADGIGRHRLVHPVEANELFVELPEAAIVGLLAAGFEFYRWGGETSRQIRLVTAFDTRAEDVDAVIATCHRLVN